MQAKHEILFELFNSREDTYAIRSIHEGHKSYSPHRDSNNADLSFTADICLSHMRGDISIGCYPLDNMDFVKWVALDFDGKRGDSLKDAIGIKQRLKKEL